MNGHDERPPAGSRPGTGRRRGLTALVALGVVVPLGAAGWLVWHQSRGGDDTARGAAPTLVPGPSGSSAPGRGESGAGKHGSGPGHGKLPLHGRTVVLDPGHNPHNRQHSQEISRSVDIGKGKTACDTEGASTRSGYPEARFTLDLAHRVRTALEKQGAKVQLTHNGQARYGPCVDERARIGNDADADAAVSLHADGAPEQDRGFHVIMPARVREGKADTTDITGPSHRLGRQLRAAFRQSTGERPADYLGDGKGLDTRGDLGGLNLSTVPKVFLECGNMRNDRDAAQLTDPKWRATAARGVASGVTDFLDREG